MNYSYCLSNVSMPAASAGGSLEVVLIAGCLLLSSMVSTASAQEVIDTKTLAERLEKECHQANLPAMWAGLYSTDSRPSVTAVNGVRKSGTHEQAQLDDLVHLGSCTKAMTAVVIAQLCSEGRLTLDQTLGSIFHDNPKVAESSWKEVSVRDLLRHRSGAPANAMNYFHFDQQQPDSVIAARGEFLEAMCKRKLHKPGQYVYSNVGYIILGHIAEKLTGQSWEDLVTMRVFNPLAITSAGFGPVGIPDGSESSDVLPGRPWGHTSSVNLLSLFGSSAASSLMPQQIDNSRCLGPAGRVHMNLNDWSKFVLHFAREDGYRQLHIHQEVWKELLEPVTDAKPGERYAGGWIVFDKPQVAQLAYFHNGSNTTWYCYALAIPSKGQCVLVATNVFSEPARKSCYDVAEFLLPTKQLQ